MGGVKVADNLMKYMISKNLRQFETLMNIMLQLPNEITTRRVIHEFQDFKKLFDSQSEVTDQFMKQMYITTPMTEKWAHIDWPEGIK